jgi:hypothetical protein
VPTDRLTPGLKTEIVTIVDDKLVVKHMGGDVVLSTPSMIALMQRASNRETSRRRFWDCRARAHHRRRNDRDRRFFDSTTTIDQLRSAPISTA